MLRLAFTDSILFHEMLTLSEQGFTYYRPLFNEMLAFWDDNSIPPKLDSFKVWCQDGDAIEQLSEICRQKKPSKTQFPVFVKLLRGSIIGRGMLETADIIAKDVGTLPHSDMLKDVISKLTDLSFFMSDHATTTRGDYWERAPERWERFKKYADDPEALKGIPFGINSLDEATGGLHTLDGEADLVGIFAKPGTYKSRLMLNMAFNQVVNGIPVMFISREMSSERLEMLLDARESLRQNPKLTLDYGLIQDAYLVGRYRKRYKALLQDVFKKARHPLWIVDSPNAMSTVDILRELEIYKTEKGEYPRVLYIDYVNLIDPVGDYGGQDYQKLDRVFIELLGICKGYKIPIVTPMRESRTGSLKKERDEVGIEHIGLSQAIAYHLHLLLHLDHSPEDIDANRLMIRAKKNRYGPLFDAQLQVIPEQCYIGDWDEDIMGSAVDPFEGL